MKDDKPKSGTRRLLSYLLVVFILCAGALAVYMLINPPKKDNYMRMMGLVDNDAGVVSSFAGSRLEFYKNGTFSVEIVYGEQKLLVGIGYYTKTKHAGADTYRFVYADAQTEVGTTNNFITLTDYITTPGDPEIPFYYTLAPKNRLHFSYEYYTIIFGK